MTAAEIREDLQRTLDGSPFAAAARAIGFTFGDVEVLEQDGRAVARVLFACVCGEIEYATLDVSLFPFDWKVDLAKFLYEHGSFSEQHLLDDGYPADFARDTSERFVAELRRREAMEARP